MVLLLPARGGDNAAGDIPVVGRPTEMPFSEASGSFTVTARAEPTAVRVEQPITLTLLVAADGPVYHPPQRIDLRQVPDFNDRFYIANPESEAAPPADARQWEFVYRLKPRRPDVTEIPGVPFAFYNPAIRPAGKAFQVKYTDAIALQVQSTPLMEPVRRVADGFLRTSRGQAILTRQAPWSPPGAVLVLLLLLVPPLGCGAWYVAWRRLYPDVRRLKERRRSRAARQALSLLDKAERASSERRPALVAGAVAGYLRERTDLAVAEPTPTEAETCLRFAGCSAAAVEQTVSLLHACDAVRFWPPLLAGGAKLPELARTAILTLDADTEAARERPPRAEEVVS
jgi:hypothetical protein